MTETLVSKQNTTERRIDGIAGQAMLLTGIDYTGTRLEADGTEVRVTRAEALRQMTRHVAACPSIGNVGHALLHGAGFEV